MKTELRLSHENFRWQKTSGVDSRVGKLTAHQVRVIRGSKGKKTAKELAVEHSVTAATIRRVWNKEVYRDVE